MSPSSGFQLAVEFMFECGSHSRALSGVSTTSVGSQLPCNSPPGQTSCTHRALGALSGFSEPASSVAGAYHSAAADNVYRVIFGFVSVLCTKIESSSLI